MSAPDPFHDRAQAATDAAFQQMYDRTPQVLELVKLRIAFWDKLVVVNAGMLALSLTAAAYFRGSQIGDGGIGHLLAAWKLVIGSIVLATLAQWFATAAATYLFRQTSALDLHLRLTRVSETLVREGRFLGEPHKSLLAQAALEADSSRVRARRIEPLAHYLGACSQIMTFVAFFQLYRYAALNLHLR